MLAWKHQIELTGTLPSPFEADALHFVKVWPWAIGFKASALMAKFPSVPLPPAMSSSNQSTGARGGQKKERNRKRGQEKKARWKRVGSVERP